MCQVVTSTSHIHLHLIGNHMYKVNNEDKNMEQRYMTLNDEFEKAPKKQRYSNENKRNNQQQWFKSAIQTPK